MALGKWPKRNKMDQRGVIWMRVVVINWGGVLPLSFTFVLGSKDLLTKETACNTQTISIFYRRLFDLISTYSH